MKKAYLIFLLASFAVSITAQDINATAEDESLIRETIQLYFDGWMTGDTTKLGTAMQHSCQLKYIKEERLVNISRAEYLGFFKPKPRMENTEGRILSIDITRGAASAKCEIEKPGRIYTDYFNMLKINGQWYITDKISTSLLTEK